MSVQRALQLSVVLFLAAVVVVLVLSEREKLPGQAGFGTMGTSCAFSCTVDADCCSGYTCMGGFCMEGLIQTNVGGLFATNTTGTNGGTATFATNGTTGANADIGTNGTNATNGTTGGGSSVGGSQGSSAGGSSQGSSGGSSEGGSSQQSSQQSSAQSSDDQCAGASQCRDFQSCRLLGGQCGARCTAPPISPVGPHCCCTLPDPQESSSSSSEISSSSSSSSSLCGNGVIDWNVGEECDGSTDGCIEKYGEYRNPACWSDCKCNYRSYCGNEIVEGTKEDCEPTLEAQGANDCGAGRHCTPYTAEPSECRCAWDVCKPQMTTECDVCPNGAPTDWILQVSGLADRLSGGTCEGACQELNGGWILEHTGKCKWRTLLVGEGPSCWAEPPLNTDIHGWPNRAPSMWSLWAKANVLIDGMSDIYNPSGPFNCNGENTFMFNPQYGEQSCTANPLYAVLTPSSVPVCSASSSSSSSSSTSASSGASSSGDSSSSASAVSSQQSTSSAESATSGASSAMSGSAGSGGSGGSGGSAGSSGSSGSDRLELSLTCGNGVVEALEQCDDGNQSNNDGCTNACRIPFCGDAVVSPPEACDDGPYNGRLPDACRPNCTLPRCGDGIVDSREACDDANRDNADGCSSACLRTLEEPCIADEECGSSLCAGGTCVKPQVCGNGVRERGEWCDPGPQGIAFAADGSAVCTSSCTWEVGQKCDEDDACGSGSCRQGVCVRKGICGDGVVDVGEECDDGRSNSNRRPGACRLSCKKAHIGDGVVDPGEQCDDGNTVDGDGCSALATLERVAAAPTVFELPWAATTGGLPAHMGAPVIGGVLDAQLLQASTVARGGVGGRLNDSGPAALAVMASGAAAGWAWIRRRKGN